MQSRLTDSDQGPRFVRYQSQFDIAREEHQHQFRELFGKNTTPAQFYASLSATVPALISDTSVVTGLSLNDRLTSGIQTYTESDWFELGKPAFRVWPSMIEPLSRTHLNISSEMFDVPFKCFAIEVPVGELRESDELPSVDSMLVSYGPVGEYTTNNLCRRLSIYTIFNSKKLRALGDNSHATSTRLDVYPNDTLDRSFERFVSVMERSSEGVYYPGPEFCKTMLTMAVSVALIGIGDSALVRQVGDTLVEQNRRKRLARRHGPMVCGDPKKQFNVGKDIKLPRLHETSGSGDESGRELTWSHYRSGHLRQVRFKDEHGKWAYRLRFIPMTRVRPDLPLAPKTRDRVVK